MAEHIFTKEDFEELDGWNKGYLVYMRGAHPDQPNIPNTYEPTTSEAQSYKDGQDFALMEVMDGEG